MERATRSFYLSHSASGSPLAQPGVTAHHQAAPPTLFHPRSALSSSVSRYSRICSSRVLRFLRGLAASFSLGSKTSSPAFSSQDNATATACLQKVPSSPTGQSHSYSNSPSDLASSR